MEPRLFYQEVKKSIPLSQVSKKKLKRKTAYFPLVADNCVIMIPSIMNCKNLK